jgi:hypothetical protein
VEHGHGHRPFMWLTWLRIPSLRHVGEHIVRVLPPLSFHHGPGDAVEDDQSVLGVLDPISRDDEHRRVELRHLHLIVALEQRHTRQVIRQLLKEQRLLLARQRIRCSAVPHRDELDLRCVLVPGQSLFVAPILWAASAS